MKPLLSCAILCALVNSGVLSAITIPDQGMEMTKEAKLSAYVNKTVGTSEILDSDTDAPGGYRVSITAPEPSQPYLAQISINCPAGGLEKGDKVLAIIKARASSGEGSLGVKLQLASSPFTEAAGATEITPLSTWNEFPVLFIVQNPLPEGKAALTLFCARTRQVVEVASIRVLRYSPQTDVSKFPRIRRTYEGREPDAPWRQAALERIEKIRKADCALHLTRADGKPFANQKVKLTLRRHEFGFGSATPAAFYAKDTPDARRYRDIIDRLFSIIVFENDLKDMWWGEKTPPHERTARNEELNQAFAWLEKRNIAVRGHYLMQVAIPSNIKEMDAAAIRRHFLDTSRQRIEFAGNRVIEWDAINHPIAWTGAKLFSKIPGLENLDREVLAQARSLTKLPMWVNEDQLFRPGAQSDDTWTYLKQLKQDGIKIDGIGNQAHLHESYLPSPESILQITDHFAQLAPHQSITEFDLQTVEDEQLAADYTRDILIACFSHPAYTSFLWWGFWEGSHWEPSAASWKKDWTILKRGEVMEEWLGKRWRTEVTATSDAAGTITWRGFPGWYDLTTEEGKKIEFQVTMKKSSATATPE
jgi:endo-1,4-beta-xylanase